MSTLTQKLIEVSKAIKYLEKDKTNKMQGYKYLSEAKIKEVIKKEFENQGIVFNYSTDDVREYEISPTSKGTKQFVTIAKGTYNFMDSENKDIDITGTWAGSGTDTGDKGLYKAITGGIKYVLNTNFLIPTGDDPEKDNEDNGKEELEGKGHRVVISPAIKDTKNNNSKINELLDLAFTSEVTKKAFVNSFKGTEKEMEKVLRERIEKEVA
jgi:hypothetical protein